MMKKVVTLVLVLSMVSMAGAAQVWTVSGSTAVGDAGQAGIEVNPGDILSMVLSVTGDTASQITINVISDGGAGGAFTSGAVNAALDQGAGGGMTMAALEAMFGSELGDDDDWAYVDAFSTATAVSADILTLGYTVGAADLGLVSITPGGLAAMGTVNSIGLLSGAVPVVGLDLNVVPEPATMALLGFGALLLRRKK